MGYLTTGNGMTAHLRRMFLMRIRKKLLNGNLWKGVDFPGFYLFGGLDEENKATNDVYFIRFDLSNNKKVIDKGGQYKQKGTIKLFAKQITPTKGIPPVARYSHGSCVFGKYLVVFGGRNDQLYSKSMQNVALNDLHLLDFHTDTWATVAIFGESIPCSRWGVNLVSSNNKVLLLGGMNLNQFCSNAVFELSFDSNKVSEYLKEKMDSKACDCMVPGTNFSANDALAKLYHGD